jgi:Putative DNA-binding domain
MRSLIELQRIVRDAVVLGNIEPLKSLVAGGAPFVSRARVHQRHYCESLSSTLMNRFRATAWLVGSRVLESAVRDFVCLSPPSAPCIAEYGEAFPVFLGVRLPSVPYVGSFAALDWQLGRLAVSVDREPVPNEVWAAVSPATVAQRSVSLQQGCAYLEAPCAIEQLMQAFLMDQVHERFELELSAVCLEARGQRGRLAVSRLPRGEWLFRRELQNGAQLGAAADRAKSVDAGFEPEAAIVSLIASSLVVSLSAPEGAQP